MLGTNPYPFTRLIDEVILWAEETGEQVIAQSGNTEIISEYIESCPFMEHEKVIRLMTDADVVVTQGGFGSLQDCISVGAKIVAVPRLIEQGESVDDQKEIVDALAKEGLVIPLYDTKELGDAIETAKASKHVVTVDNRLPVHIAETINSMLTH